MDLDIAARIRTRMGEKGLSARALSIKAGLNDTAARDVFSGKSVVPRLRTLVGFANALGCAVSDLVTAEEIAQFLSAEHGLTARQVHELETLQNELRDIRERDQKASAGAPNDREALDKQLEENHKYLAEVLSVDPPTPHEVGVFLQLREGMPNKIIAHELGISEDAVKEHVRHIMRKMGATNEARATFKTLRQRHLERQPEEGKGDLRDRTAPWDGEFASARSAAKAELDLVVRDQEGRRLDFTGANLRGVNLSHTNLRGAIFHRADLTEADLSYSDLRMASFTAAIMDGTILVGSDLSGADLAGADLTKAKLVK
jgi:DNA-binding CsgD family transcriptional regulator